MIDPYTLKPGDRVRTRVSHSPTGLLTVRGAVDAKAAGCVVIKWNDRPGFDPLLLTSLMWRFMELDE